MDTPGTQPTRLSAVPDKWVRPTRRLADLSVGPTDLVGSPDDLLETFQKIPQMTSFCTTSRVGAQGKTSVDFAKSRSTGYGNMCNVYLGLLVVTDQESGNRPHPLANIKRTRRPLVQSGNPISSNLHQQLDVSGCPNQYKLIVFSMFRVRGDPLYNQAIQSQAIYTNNWMSPGARTSINSSCSLCFAYSCATLEFLALDSSPPMKDRYGQPERGVVNGSRQKFFSKEMGSPTRRTRLPTHVSDSLPKLVKPTQPLECYWT
jgi:hypothetical protein